MKLNNKGFAISTIMYKILILAVILIVAILSILSARKLILDNIKKDVISSINPGIKIPEVICEAVDSTKAGSVKRGVEYECQLNSTTTKNFYILSTDGDNVNLMMKDVLDMNGETYTYFYHNDEGDVGDIESQLGYSYGEDFIFKNSVAGKVEEYTKNWIFLSNYNIEDNLGGVPIKWTGKARLPKYSEIASLCPCVGTTYFECGEEDDQYCSSHETGAYRYQCPAWITERFYWTMDFADENEADPLAAWAITPYSTLDDKNISNNQYSIRPVITIPKTRLAGYDSDNDDDENNAELDDSQCEVPNPGETPEDPDDTEEPEDTEKYTCQTENDTYTYKLEYYGDRQCKNIPWTLYYEDGSLFKTGSTEACESIPQDTITSINCDDYASASYNVYAYIVDDNTETDDGYDSGGDSGDDSGDDSGGNSGEEAGTCSVIVDGSLDVAPGQASVSLDWTYADAHNEDYGSTTVYFDYTEGSEGVCKTEVVCDGYKDSDGNDFEYTVCGFNSAEEDDS